MQDIERGENALKTLLGLSTAHQAQQQQSGGAGPSSGAHTTLNHTGTGNNRRQPRQNARAVTPQRPHTPPVIRSPSVATAAAAHENGSGIVGGGGSATNGGEDGVNAGGSPATIPAWEGLFSGQDGLPFALPSAGGPGAHTNGRNSSSQQGDGNSASAGVGQTSKPGTAAQQQPPSQGSCVEWAFLDLPDTTNTNTNRQNIRFFSFTLPLHLLSDALREHTLEAVQVLLTQGVRNESPESLVNNRLPARLEWVSAIPLVLRNVASHSVKCMMLLTVADERVASVVENVLTHFAFNNHLLGFRRERRQPSSSASTPQPPPFFPLLPTPPPVHMPMPMPPLGNAFVRTGWQSPTRGRGPFSRARARGSAPNFAGPEPYGGWYAYAPNPLGMPGYWAPGLYVGSRPSLLVVSWLLGPDWVCLRVISCLWPGKYCMVGGHQLRTRRGWRIA